MKILVLIMLFLITFQLASFSQKANNDFLIAYIDSTSGDELYGYMNINNEIMITPKFSFTYTDTMYNFAIVLWDNTWVGINRDEKIILHPYLFDNGPDYVSEGLFRFVENNKVGYANLKGEKVIAAVFDFATPFNDGIAVFNIGGEIEKSDSEHKAWVGGLWGYINKKGKVIIEPKYLSAGDFENGKAKVTDRNGTSLIINKKGNIVKK